MPFGVYVAAPLLDVCVKKNEGYLSWFACKAVRQVCRLPIAAIIDDGASAGAIAAICENAPLGHIQWFARIQGGVAGLSSLPFDCVVYGSGRCFTAKSPRGNDSTRLPANRCERYARHKQSYAFT